MKILVVDDNPHVLALMQKTLEKHGDVEAYHDGAEALARATATPPDLIVSDYRLKGMNGRQFLEAVRARPGTREVPFILVASKADIEESLQAVADQVDDFLSKPFFARDLVHRAKRALDKAFLAKKQAEAAAAGAGAIRGKLSEMNVMDLFQSLEMGAKSCLLAVGDGRGEQAQLYFADGQVYHCVMGSVTGDAVVNQIVKWQEGTFEINFSAARPTESNTSTGTQGLLMEALRLLDEENR